MDSDKRRYDEVYSTMRSEGNDFQVRITELLAHHSHILKELEAENRSQIEAFKEETEELFKIKAVLKDENMETRRVQDELMWERIDVLKDKNKEELARTIEAGMEHKQKLTLAVEKLQAAK